MPKPDDSAGGRSRSAAGYEQRDVNPKWILGIAVGLVVAGVITHFVIVRLEKRLAGKVPTTDQWSGARRTPFSTTRRPAFPVLQVSPATDLNGFRAREEAELNGYGWINRTAGVVRIPIDRAMDLVLQQGLPARNGTNESQAGPSSYELQMRRPGYNYPEVQTPK